MTLRIGSKVSWSNYPLPDRRGTIVAVIPTGSRPDGSQFADARRYLARNHVSYLVREEGRHGRLFWPSAQGLTVTAPPPPVLPLTEEERLWCDAHPDAVRAAMKAANAASISSSRSSKDRVA